MRALVDKIGSTASNVLQDDYMSQIECGQTPHSDLLSQEESLELIYNGIKYNIKTCCSGPGSVHTGLYVQVEIRTLSDGSAERQSRKRGACVLSSTATQNPAVGSGTVRATCVPLISHRVDGDDGLQRQLHQDTSPVVDTLVIGVASTESYDDLASLLDLGEYNSEESSDDQVTVVRSLN
ncbi:hypothetical protein DVH05_017241 [Phytophthora capsici]|nr:hypothetical protein DVH05_017241 [Phytophthora capsici]